VASGRELGHVTSKDGFFTATFDDANDRLLTATDDVVAQLWDLREFTLLRSFEHTSAIRSAAVSADGRFIATGARNGTVSVWDADHGIEIARFHHAQFALYVAFDPVGGRLLSTGNDGVANVWDVSSAVPDAVVVREWVRCHVPYELSGTALERAADRECRSADQLLRSFP
jgi:WD40 repeat protein